MFNRHSNAASAPYRFVPHLSHVVARLISRLICAHVTTITAAHEAKCLTTIQQVRDT